MGTNQVELDLSTQCTIDNNSRSREDVWLSGRVSGSGWSCTDKTWEGNIIASAWDLKFQDKRRTTHYLQTLKATSDLKEELWKGKLFARVT